MREFNTEIITELKEGKSLCYNPNAIVEVAKDFSFDSCHNLIDYDGKCKYLHGHTYKLRVAVFGTCDEKGMLLDFSKLKALVNDQIVDKVDHNYLNSIFECNTTAENMVVIFYSILETSIRELTGDRVNLAYVKLWETPTSFATFNGAINFHGAINCEEMEVQENA